LSPVEYATLKAFPSKSPEGQRVAADKDGPYVVLADFGGGRRGLESLLYSYGVPLDFDSGVTTAEVIAKTLAGYAYAAYTTYAHQMHAERWRVFVPVSAPMDADTHRATWHALDAMFGGAADPAAKDASRLSYRPGPCLEPSAARIFHADGAFFAPVPPAPEPPSVLLQAKTDGPVAGWGGPTDDTDLVRVAREMRTRPDERFGQPVHFAALWDADAAWLSQRFPPKADSHQSWDYTQADMALAGELAYLTGSDAERMVRLMRESGLAHLRADDSDWHERKVPLTVRRAVANQKQWAFMARAQAAADGDCYTSLIDRTDRGNANLLIRQANGTLRYVAETKQWLYWTGKRWQLDEHEVFVSTRATEIAKHYLQEAQRLKNAGREDLGEDVLKWATKCRNKKQLDDMIALARKSENVPISITQLDRDSWLLGVENGVVDLRTGDLRAEAREDFVTKRCPFPFNPFAKAPRWEAFIAEISGAPIPAARGAGGALIPDSVGRFTLRPALAHYLHKALGYSITGSTREQKLFLAIGAGSNGKNVVFEAVKRVLGNYARVLPAEALMATNRGADAERPTALAASLAGARFVLASETKDGQSLDVGLVKNHTGDREMTARRMRENPFTFEITHKVWLMTNHRPALDHIDTAIRGRLHLVPFHRRWNRPGEFERDPLLPDGDKELATQLAREAEGILAWLVRGAVLYQREGLPPPDEVVALTHEYVQEQDHFGRWLSTLHRCPANDGTFAAELFRQFCQWCASDGCAIEPRNPTAFGRALHSRGIESVDHRQGKRYGLRGATTNHTWMDPATVGFGNGPLPAGAIPIPPTE
jgi:P4 family phage/plasmid primase-like protien